MTGVGTAVPVEQAVSIDEVRNFRQRAVANGYALVRVRTHSKSPLARAWQHGESRDALSDVRADALNTGLILAGLRCIDIDVDHPQLVSEILESARQHLPGGALRRNRANSPRAALLFRAAEGKPPKRFIKGPNGKIEVLGDGQQAVVHGLHPSGTALTWADGRAPDTVSLSDLPAVSEKEIDNFLSACAPVLGVADAQSRGVSSLDRRPAELGALLPVAKSFNTAPLPNDLSAGIEVPHWFTKLSSEEKHALVAACLQVLDNRASDPREKWLRVLFALGDAERLGCADAHQLALEWSRQGASWTGEADFEAAWHSYKAKPGGITIGSLISMARDAGLDVSPWRDPVLARLGSQCANAAAPGFSPSAPPQSPRALNVAALPSIPPKRHWLYRVFAGRQPCVGLHVRHRLRARQ